MRLLRPPFPADLEFSGQFAPQEERQYRHVPFSVPEGVQQLHFAISYSDRIGSSQLRRGGNTLDAGVFDEEGIEAGGPGFRGWSGSELTAFTIDEQWATPPYRSGEIGAGRWHLLLAAYKVSKQGLDFRAEIWFDRGILQPPQEIVRMGPAARAGVPAAAEPGWFRGDLHTHSIYSDGDSWPSELLIEAGARGLDFLAITDHNGAVREQSLSERGDNLPLLVPGIEVTTYRGHWNAWGVDGWFDFRTSTNEEMRSEMRRAIAAGAFLSINHPKPFGPEWEYEEGHGEVHAMEVWNGPWERLNLFALMEWEEQLMSGRRLVAIGGSDAHYLRSTRTEGPIRDAQIGEPTTWVRVEGDLSVDSLLAGLRAGNCFISFSPAGPQIFLDRKGASITIRVVGAENCKLQAVTRGEVVSEIAIEESDWSGMFQLSSEDAYLRFQVLNERGLHLAISNPVWNESPDLPVNPVQG